MSVEKRTATVYRLYCDVPNCGISSPERLSIGEASGHAVTECGWMLFGAAYAMCNQGDSAHKQAIAVFTRKLDDEMEP